MKCVTAALLTLWCAGCTVHHLEKNAPGHVDVRTPPAHPEQRAVEPPGDPGEQAVWLTYGALAGGGLGFPKSGSVVGSYGLGPELSVHVGGFETSHTYDGPPLLPERAIGMNVGWTALAHPGTGVGPVYGELQHTERPFHLAPGWAWDADDGRHGPQATLGIGPLYVRYTHLFDQGGALHLGLVFKGYDAWVWSR